MVQDTITHDFYEEVPLADSEASQFVFSFWMYDGDDLLYSVPDVIHVDIGGGKNYIYIYVCVCVYRYVCMYVCMYVYMYVCIDGWMDG